VLIYSDIHVILVILNDVRAHVEWWLLDGILHWCDPLFRCVCRVMCIALCAVTPPAHHRMSVDYKHWK